MKPNKYAIIFGGTGYIGSFLTKELLKEKMFNQIVLCDLEEKEFEQHFRGFENVKFKHIDVRKPISLELDNINIENSWIFNFAAVHREPGHEYHEYFDTNISGAKNVNEFARKSEIRNIFFTSSIAPYGKSLHQRDENSNLYPETAYGISKGWAEQIHQTWLAEDKTRRLIIVRPSVIFGPEDPGNVYRMINSLKKGTFILPNGGNIIKGYGYVFGLVESMIFTINLNQKLIIYNYAENPVVPLKEMVRIAKNELNIKKPTISLSINILSVIAFFIQKTFRIIGKKSDIHPVRVKKAGFPTNVKPQFLIDNGFEFKYDFLNALKHWKQHSPKDFEL